MRPDEPSTLPCVTSLGCDAKATIGSRVAYFKQSTQTVKPGHNIFATFPTPASVTEIFPPIVMFCLLNVDKTLETVFLSEPYSLVEIFDP